VLTHKNLIVNAMTSAQEACLSLPRRPDLPFVAPKVMSITPFFHIAGVMSIIKNVVSVTPMVVMEFDPLELLKTIERERVTFLFLVPTMWLIVMDHPDFKKVVAYVVRRPGATAGANDIIVYVGGDLASYKKPKEVLFVDELPISATGKILKREIRKAYMSRLKEKE
jgi:acyl-CoA synthetase (AMP-forming)/AMP-acid ligase II